MVAKKIEKTNTPNTTNSKPRKRKSYKDVAPNKIRAAEILPAPLDPAPHRPLAAPRPDYRHVDTLTADIDAYISSCDQAARLPTITGLAVWLGVDEVTLRDWESARIRTRDGHELEHYHKRASVLKSARAAIIDRWQARLAGGGQGAGAIFWLKNVAGWKDEVQISQSSLIVTLSDTELVYRLSQVAAAISSLRRAADDAGPQVLDIANIVANQNDR